MRLEYQKMLELTEGINIHEFQPGVLITYQDSPKKLKQFGFDDYSFTLNQKETYLCKPGDLKKGIRNHCLERQGVGAQRFAETTYELSKVFDRAYYKSRDSFKSQCRHPLNVFSRRNLTIRECGLEDLGQIEEVHKLWVNHKLEDPKVFRIIFPKVRYLRCAQYSINKIFPGLVCLGIFDNTKLIGYEAFYLRDSWAYGLAYILEPSELVGSLSEGVLLSLMKYLKETYNIEYFNVGQVGVGASAKGLRAFKHKWPFEEVCYYDYSKGETKCTKMK